MRNHSEIHESFMNPSRMIPPRVGVGVGVRGGDVSHPCLSSNWGWADRPLMDGGFAAPTVVEVP